MRFRDRPEARSTRFYFPTPETKGFDGEVQALELAALKRGKDFSSIGLPS